MTINDFLNMYNEETSEGFNKTRPRLVCKDGWSVSAQAGKWIYSVPARRAFYYTHIELGFPSSIESWIMNYAEDSEKPTETVYKYVPVGLVDKVIAAHGGIVSVDFDNLSEKEKSWNGY